MRFLSLFLVFFFLILTVIGKGDANEPPVDGSVNTVNVVKQGKAHELCGKEGVECKEGQEKGADEGVFENEDYIYTQSVP